MAGSARISAHSLSLAALLGLLLAAGPAAAQSLYKYQGADGEWIYADRPPDDDSLVEVRVLEDGGAADVGIDVTYEFRGRTVELVAANPSYVPIELTLEFRTIRGVEFPDPDDDLRWVVPPRSDTLLMALDLLENATAPFLEFQYRYLAGDPNARHRPAQPYRAPFAAATHHPITQAFPQVATHTTRDSQYAVDIAMPIGTDVMAARGGVVFDVAASNFSGGLDPARDGPRANVVRILHDDGTYAIYAHLNTNTIRVRPGDRVQRGQYIADSGNTGFSSGPHLHFAVVRNAGMRIESVPVTFEGSNAESIVPAAGNQLTAY
jgi:murein DD-endopeptidase MepM/ murein hydrolase activator NlpD